MKIVTWLILIAVLVLSLLKGIFISNGQLAVLLMLLLLSLFSDLKEFDFWGLKGKKNENEIKELEGKKAFAEKEKNINKKKLDEAEKQAPLQLMDTAQGNFLALAFEIERLLRIFATVWLAKDIQNNVNVTNLTKELRQKDLLTDNGVKQLEAIRWIRNLLVHGRQNELNQATLDTGIQIAQTLYMELYNNLYS
ncbi:MAG: hypothetical protein ABH819_00775 [Patescibacteria group bacterium]|nr:hypothetical protein [Patescibacteria group bacterium]